MTLRFTGTISVPRLIRSVERLVQRHDALRASFDELGSLMQISSALRIAVPVTDLSNIADQAEREKRLQNLISQETALPFTLPAGRCSAVKSCCWRLTPLQLSSPDTILFATAGRWMF